MIYSSEHFKVGRLLAALSQSLGGSEVGYRAQGFFAHVLMRLGGRILDIKAQGHPDITASLGGKDMFIQVKSVQTKGSRRRFDIGVADLEGIRPSGSNTAGYLAVLDYAAPVSWILVDYDRLRREELRPVHMVTLRAMANRSFSFQCTEEFVGLILKHQNHLRNLGFHILCNHALRGDAL